MGRFAWDFGGAPRGGFPSSYDSRSTRSPLVTRRGVLDSLARFAGTLSRIVGALIARLWRYNYRLIATLARLDITMRRIFRTLFARRLFRAGLSLIF